jgi:hypothetical protein
LENKTLALLTKSAKMAELLYKYFCLNKVKLPFKNFSFCLKQDERPTRPFFHPPRGGPGGGRGGGPGFPRFGRGGGGGGQQQHLRPFAPFGGSIGLPGHPGLDLSKVNNIFCIGLMLQPVF